MKTYDDILFDEYGESIPLSADDFIEYLLDIMQRLRSERDRLEKQLADIRAVLNNQKDSTDVDF
jgi:hypothetical protein